MIDSNGTIFVSSKGTNNGISARINDNSNAKKYKAGAITVALKGNVMSAFLQYEDFYIAHQTAVLYPKKEMSDEVKLFYCLCLSNNKYRYNYGRQADRTLKEILVPSENELPNWINEVDLNSYDNLINPIINSPTPNLGSKEWGKFKFDDLFELKKGKRLTKADMKKGNTPFIGAIDGNNGYREYIGQKPIHSGNTITVNYNGNGVAEAFYQPNPYWCSDDVNVLYPRFELNNFIAMFICTVIRLEKYRFNYGRKWHLERMRTSQIKLPVTKFKKPDFDFMENYIKTLNYSKQI